MFILLICLAQLFSPSASAQIAEARKSDIFYDISGGARMRYFQYEKASGGNILKNEEDYSNMSSRLQLDFRLDKGEFFQTYFRAINTGDWGSDSDDRSEFTLQQAWAMWHIDEVISLQFGRIPLEIGRGLVYGFNEWENLPTYYDGLSFKLDWSVMELFFHGLVIDDLERIEGTSVASDPETTNFIVDLSFKDLSEIIEMADLHYALVSSDIGQRADGSTAPKQTLQRFGADFILSGLYYRLSGSLAYVSGTITDTSGEKKAKQVMIDTEARGVIQAWEDLNFWFGYHYDSGDDNPTDGDDSQYAGLNYNIHQNAGRLDFFRFGNLSFMRLGFSMKTRSEYYFGAEVFQFEKSEIGAGNQLATSILADEFAAGTYQFGNSRELGTELDIWLGKKFQSGVAIELGFNYLKPGDALKTTELVATSALSPIDNSIYNFYIDVGMFF